MSMVTEEWIQRKKSEGDEQPSYEVTDLNVILFSCFGEMLFRSGSPREFHELLGITHFQMKPRSLLRSGEN